jgi:Periplasmic binding protein-like domain
VGFDDIRLAQFMIPPLTTVQMSQTELAQIAFKALMNEVERESPSERRIDYELNTHLVLRRSTALAPILDGRLKPLRITGTAKKTPKPGGGQEIVRESVCLKMASSRVGFKKILTNTLK